MKKVVKKVVLWISCLVCVVIISKYQCFPEFASSFFLKKKFYTDEALSCYKYTFLLGIVMSTLRISRVEFFLLLVILGIVPCFFSGLFFLGFLEGGNFGNLLAIGYLLTFAMVPATPVIFRYVFSNIIKAYRKSRIVNHLSERNNG